MVKIAFDAKRAFCNRTGLGNYSRTLISTLIDYCPDHEYLLYTPEQKISFLNERKNLPQVKIYEPNDVLMKTFHPIWRTFSITSLLKKELIENKLHIYHGLSHELPFGIHKIKQLNKVVTVHDLIHLRFPHFYPFLDRKIYDLKLKYACESATKIVAICKQTADDLKNFYSIPEEKIKVIYQSIDDRFYHMVSEEEKQRVQKKYNLPQKFILYVGTLQERKNAKSIIKALGLIKNKISVPLILIGSGPKDYLDHLWSLVREFQLEKQVCFLGSINFEDLKIFYQLSFIFVYPSFFEGFGLPIVEALASGTPVITSKGSCFPEAAGPGALYVDPDNPEELSCEIERLLTNESLRIKLVYEGQKYIQIFAKDHIAKHWDDFYKNI